MWAPPDDLEFPSTSPTPPTSPTLSSSAIQIQRFGLALTFDGHVNLRLKKYSRDFNVIDPGCHCPTCDYGNTESGTALTRSYLHLVAGRETVGAHAVTLHNIAYQVGEVGVGRGSGLEIMSKYETLHATIHTPGNGSSSFLIAPPLSFLMPENQTCNLHSTVS